MTLNEALIKYNEVDKRVGIKPFWEVRDIIEDLGKSLEVTQKDLRRLYLLFDSEFCRCSNCGELKRAGFGCYCEDEE